MKAAMRVIVNPVAANGAVGKRWPQIRDILRAEGGQFDAALTEGPNHATELSREALSAGYRTIVAVGGDGTLNEVVNGLVIEGMVDPMVNLGIIPGGTGSDSVRTLGIPHDYRAACQRLLHGKPDCVDLGLVTCASEGREIQRYFLNVAGLGFDGEVCERVNRSSKALGGTLPFLSSLFVNLLTYQNKTVEVTLDGQQRLQQKANSVFVCNGRYAGGSMHIGPNAALDDGIFDVVIIGDTGKLEIVVNLPRIYRGTHLSHPKVDEYRAQEIRVKARERMLLQADGELIGEAPATFQIIPQALHVLV
ncbi:MAG: diacylglycerol kinase family lipid kinase [Anaerolineales bacterium]|nr:MAG: diacylglycerol kinase family lipid kinase [Anaerolineales bacterium]